MLLATVLGSGIAFLDATVVNVALPTIGEDLDAGISSLQWVVNAYTLTLSGFLLLGGSLGDHYGRRRVFVIGVIWFAVASLLCGLAPTDEALIAARALQGVGGALLTPGSLAIIEASFRREDRAPAIGAWSGLGGVTAAIGPFLGGWLVQAATWRLIFLINLPLAAVVVWVSVRHVPETRDPGATGRLDWGGAALAAAGLAGVVYALTDGPAQGWTSPVILAAGIGGVAALVAFVLWERRVPAPMLPLDIFASRQFTAANLVTFVVYGALGGSLFLLPIQLQRVVGYTPLASGVALVPVTLVLLAAVGQVGPPGLPDRAAAAHDRRAAARGRRVCPVHPHRARGQLPGRHPAGVAGLRVRAGPDGGPADLDGARRRPGRARRDRLGGQQRRRPDRRAAGRGRPAGGGRHLGR